MKALRNIMKEHHIKTKYWKIMNLKPYATTGLQLRPFILQAFKF